MACRVLCSNISSDRGATSAWLLHLCERFWDPTTRCDGNGKASKVQASIGRYVVRQHVGTLGGISTSENVSIKGQESSEHADHSITINTMRSAPTRTANMKGKAGSDDGWSKDREETHLGPEEDEAARPTASLRKQRSQDQVASPVATQYVLGSDSG